MTPPERVRDSLINGLALLGLDSLREANQIFQAMTVAHPEDIRYRGLVGVVSARLGDEEFMQIRDELVSRTYLPMRNRKKEIPKDHGKVRVLSIPSIRDRVVQGAPARSAV